MAGKKSADEATEKELEVKNQGANIRAAVAMHLAGFGYDVIAERRGYSSPKDAQIVIERFIGETFTSSDLVSARNKSLARKERLLSSVWNDSISPFLLDESGRATEDRNEMHIPSLDRAIRIAESIDRLLGLNAPTQVEVYRPGADEFLSTVAELRAQVMAGQPQEGDIFDAEVVDDEDGGVS